MKRNTRVSGHGLQHEGKAVVRIEDDAAGGRWYRLTYEAEGVAYCECGEPSPELPSNAARKRWHADHKMEVIRRMRRDGNYHYPDPGGSQ